MWCSSPYLSLLFYYTVLKDHTHMYELAGKATQTFIAKIYVIYISL